MYWLNGLPIINKTWTMWFQYPPARNVFRWFCTTRWKLQRCRPTVQLCRLALRQEWFTGQTWWHRQIKCAAFRWSSDNVFSVESATWDFTVLTQSTTALKNVRLTLLSSSVTAFNSTCLVSSLCLILKIITLLKFCNNCKVLEKTLLIIVYLFIRTIIS